MINTLDAKRAISALIALSIFTYFVISQILPDVWNQFRIVLVITQATIFIGFLFWRYIWWLFERFEAVFPDLNGSWNGELRFDRMGKQCSIAFVAKIKTGFWRVHFEFETKKARSVPIALKLASLNEGGSRLYYVYESNPKFGAKSAAPKHLGAAELLLIRAKDDILEGNYFTANGGIGTVRLNRVSKSHNNYLKLQRAVSVF